jgi:archaeal flagellar protein FlaJ
MSEAVAQAGKATAASRLMERYRHVAYRALGRRLERDHPRLRAQLVQAGLRVSPGMFLALLASSSVLGGLLFAGIGALVLFLPAPSAATLGMAFGAGLLAAALAPIAFLMALRSRIQNRRMAVDRELPFSLSELSVLASVGLAPIQLIRRMASRSHDPAMTAEFRKVVARIDTEGRDLVTALADTARETPSDALRTVLWDMANVVHQGGDLEAFLRGQSDTVLESLRSDQKAFTDRLGTFADMYITIVLLGIMFLAVGAFLIDAFRTTAGGLSAGGIITALTYGLVPLITIVLALLLGSAHGKGGGS